MELSSENVTSTFKGCLFKEDELDTAKDVAIVAEGVMMTIGFEPERLESAKDDVLSMLKCLDPTFFRSEGGGWSFLNMCNDGEGKQWTGEHRVMDELVCLALALKLCSYGLGREFWDAFPGGMPYITVEA